MSWSAARAAFADTRSDVFGEATDFVATGIPAVRVRGIWGRIEQADTGNGYIADTTVVQVPAADLADWRGSLTPSRGVTTELVRYPTAIRTRERWIAADVSRLDADTWEIRVWKLPGATVQGSAT